MWIVLVRDRTEGQVRVTIFMHSEPYNIEMSASSEYYCDLSSV